MILLLGGLIRALRHPQLGGVEVDILPAQPTKFARSKWDSVSELGGIMARSTTVQFFKCASCDALYQVVKAEAGPETHDGEVA